MICVASIIVLSLQLGARGLEPTSAPAAPVFEPASAIVQQILGLNSRGDHVLIAVETAMRESATDAVGRTTFSDATLDRFAGEMLRGSTPGILREAILPHVAVSDRTTSSYLQKTTDRRFGSDGARIELCNSLYARAKQVRFTHPDLAERLVRAGITLASHNEWSLGIGMISPGVHVPELIEAGRLDPQQLEELRSVCDPQSKLTIEQFDAVRKAAHQWGAELAAMVTEPDRCKNQDHRLRFLNGLQAWWEQNAQALVIRWEGANRLWRFVCICRHQGCPEGIAEARELANRLAETTNDPCVRRWLSEALELDGDMPRSADAPGFSRGSRQSK